MFRLYKLESKHTVPRACLSTHPTLAVNCKMIGAIGVAVLGLPVLKIVNCGSLPLDQQFAQVGIYKINPQFN